LLKGHIGDEFPGVITGITNFGIFVQLTDYLIDGLIRYEDLMDDWWDVDERAGRVVGQRTGTVIRIGDAAKVIIVAVDEARRELNLAISQLMGHHRGGGKSAPPPAKHAKKKHKSKKFVHNDGASRRNQKSKQRSRKGRSRPTR
jgi:ribonuclease R